MKTSFRNFFALLGVIYSFSAYSQTITLTDKESNTTQTIGLGSGSVKSGEIVSDKILLQFKVGVTTIEDVTAVLGQPKKEMTMPPLKGGKQFVSLIYMSMDQSNSINAAAFIPIFGTLLQKTTIDSKTQTLTFIFDKGTGRLFNLSNNLQGGVTESKSDIETLQNISIGK
jgi:hypothetical protein